MGEQQDWAKCHVAVAVSCCLGMALWRTLWKADQVSRMASGGLSASFMRLLMNFLAWYPGRPVVSRMNGTRLTWISGNFDLLCSLGHVTWAGAGCCDDGSAAGEWSDTGDIEVRGGTVLIKEKIHACVFDLAIHDTSEGRNGLLDEPLGAPCVSVSHQLGTWPLRHACDRHRLRIDTHSSSAVARPQMCHRSDPLRTCWGMSKRRPRGLGLQAAVT